MFQNVAAKLKTLAKAMLCVGLSLTALTVILIFDGADSLFDVILNAAVGVVATLSAAFLLYGVGETLDKLKDIELQDGVTKSEAQKAVERNRVRELEKLRSHGLITEKEYLAAATDPQAKFEHPHAYRDMKKLQADYDRGAISPTEYKNARTSVLKNM